MLKIVAVSALLAVARAGDLLTAPVYSAAPAVSHVSYASPLLKAAAPLSVATHVAAAPYAVHTPQYAVHAPQYAYHAPQYAIHAPAIGSSHQSTVRSLDGNSAVSHYSKSVDTAFSSVRKYDTRVTNDAKLLAPVTYAAPLVKTAPVYTHYAAAAPIVKSPVFAQYAAAPVVKTAPLLTQYAAAAPVVKTAPVVAEYAPAAAHVVSHTTFSGLGTAYAF